MADRKSKNKYINPLKYIFEPIKKISKSKFLAEKYGGKWKFDGMACWWCDDGKRHVARTASCCCDDENCGCPSQYWLYGDGTPEMVYWNK